MSMHVIYTQKFSFVKLRGWIEWQGRICWYLRYFQSDGTARLICGMQVNIVPQGFKGSLHCTQNSIVFHKKYYGHIY